MHWNIHTRMRAHDTDLTCLVLGRTTFVNTLCGKGVLTHKDSDDPSDAHVEEGVKIKPITVGKKSSKLL